MPGSLPPFEWCSDLDAVQRNFDMLARSWPQTVPPVVATGVGSPQSSFVEYGPYTSTVATSLGANSDVSVTITHNLNLTTNQQNNLTVLYGTSIDGGFAALMSLPRIESQTANQISFKLGNPSDNTITASFKCWIRVPAV